MDGEDIGQNGPVGYNFEPPFADAQVKERSNNRRIIIVIIINNFFIVGNKITDS